MSDSFMPSRFFIELKEREGIKSKKAKEIVYQDMRRTTLKILIAFLTFTIGAAAVFLFAFRDKPRNLNTQVSPSVESDEAEERAVYSVILNERFVKESVKLLAISDQTLFYDNNSVLGLDTFEARLQHKKEHFISVAEDTFIDFDSKSAKSSKLNSNFNLPVKYVLINKSELIETETDGRDGKYFLYEKYPEARGLISLSKVGFNKEKNQAFVEVGFTFCVPLCGRGDYILLEKENGVWKVKEIFNKWIS